MNDQELNEWCKMLLDKVRDRWRDVRSKYPDVDVLEGGWGVLYSPIRLRPDLMIIGINPGGDRTDFNENEALQIPKQHEYFDCSVDNHGKPRNGYKLATKTVNVFSDMNLKDLLKESVKLNLLFFRSRNWKHWETVKEPLRKELESFCADLVLEFIKVLKPRTILAESKSTYRKLHDTFKERAVLPVKEFPDLPQCYIKTQYAELMLIGIDHLTGARIRAEDRETAKKLLSADLLR